MNASPIEEQNRKLFELENAFERSRAAEVPTYAPASFAKAQRLLQDIRQEWPEYRSRGTLEEQIALVGSALEEASAKAEAAEPRLSNLVRMRAQAIRSSAVAYHAPLELKEAEGLFWDAVRSAEDQDFATTEEIVAAGERRYFEATLKSLEKGALQDLENDVEYAKDLVSGDLYAEAQAELKDLRDATRAARSGEIPPSTLRTRIANRATRLRGRLDTHGGGALDPDWRDPPKAPGGGWAPGTFDPPEAPVTMRIRERKPDALTVSWMDRAPLEEVNFLERSVADGAWQVVAEFGPVSGFTEFEDTGLEPDTKYRYRVRVENEFGSNVTTWDNIAVGYTRTTEDLPVWRVQLYIRVADVPDAGTGDSVQVHLNSPLLTYAPNGNNTWLDHAPRLTSVTPPRWEDDFGRGSEFLYDVKSQYVRQLSDITLITLRKQGTDALGIAELALVVNGREVFRKFFGDTASTCLWLDEGEGHSPIFSIWHPELRAAEDWQSYMQAPPDFPNRIPNDEIVSRFEAIAGDSLHGTRARWRAASRPVRVTRATVAGEEFEKVHVRLLLRGDADLFPDPDITLGFDLQVSINCNEENTEATLNLVSDEVQASADFDLLVDALLLAAAPAGEALLVYAMYLAREAAKAGWQPIVEHLALDPPVPGACPKVQIDQEPNGDAIVTFRPF